MRLEVIDEELVIVSENQDEFLELCGIAKKVDNTSGIDTISRIYTTCNNDKLKDEISYLENEIEELESDISELEDADEEAYQTISDLKVKVHDLEEEIKKLKEYNNSI